MPASPENEAQLLDGIEEEMERQRVVLALCHGKAAGQSPVALSRVDRRRARTEAAHWMERALQSNDALLVYAGPNEPDLGCFQFPEAVPPDNDAEKRVEKPLSTRRRRLKIRQFQWRILGLTHAFRQTLLISSSTWLLKS